MKLFFRELGAGPPVVMIHGVLGSSDNLLTVAKLLADQYKLYLLDARNHGQSPHSEEFTYEAMAEDLKEFLLENNIKDAVIIGHSMGGKIVMKFASIYPDMGKKYIIMDISPRFYKRHHDQILEGLNSINIKDLQSRQDADKQLSNYVTELPVRQFLLKNLDRTSDGFKWKLNLPVITEKIENIGEALPENTKVSKPTLFIRGSESDYIREKDEELIRKMFSDVKVQTLEGAGHWLHAEKPEEFSQMVRKFIEVS